MLFSDDFDPSGGHAALREAGWSVRRFVPHSCHVHSLRMNHGENHRGLENHPDCVPALLASFDSVQNQAATGIVKDELCGFKRDAVLAAVAVFLSSPHSYLTSLLYAEVFRQGTGCLDVSGIGNRRLDRRRLVLRGCSS